MTGIERNGKDQDRPRQENSKAGTGNMTTQTDTKKRIAIITVAGISSRFNEGLPEEAHVLKAICYDEDPAQTLLYHLLKKCAYADRIVIVGGYRFQDLEAYCSRLDDIEAERLRLIYNDRYADLASGYSLYLGIAAALKEGATEILFAEGDLDVDDVTFERIVRTDGSVLTFNREPVYANKAVVLYQDAEGKYRYAFNAEHGLLQIDEPFSCLLNSGQIWKFSDTDVLREANERFIREHKDGTNLHIIQAYIDRHPACTLIGFETWTNCNTREDYRRIVTRWERNIRI